MRRFSLFVAWTHRDGHPSDRDRTFTPVAVERYIATAATHLAVSSRDTRRSDLWRFSRQITTKAPCAPDTPQLKQRRTLVLFTQDKTARLWEIANNQITKIRRRRFTGCRTRGTGLHPQGISTTAGSVGKPKRAVQGTTILCARGELNPHALAGTRT